MKILKFGGSSLATTDCIRDVASIVLEEARREPVIVVVSAFQGVTNQLLECARLAERGDAKYDDLFSRIADRHRAAVATLLGGRNRSVRRRAARRRGNVKADIDAQLAELRSTL